MEKPFLTVVMFVITMFLCTAQASMADSNATTDAQSHSDTTDQKVENSTVPKADNAKSDHAADHGESKQQVQAWFAQYDQIRRDAEMTLQEKLQSHGLFTKGLEGTQSASQGDKSSRFATTMTERYADASTKIKGLPELTATAELQKGYSEFFTKCSNLFHEYLLLQNSTGDKKESKAKLLSNKEKLTALDKKDKALDAELRNRYGVKAHKHK